MKLRDALVLGRVSNLPTVWSNVLAGAVLAGAELGARTTIATMIALSLFYVAGMVLNDWFDRGFDSIHRPDRPIPAGRVKAKTALIAGVAMLAIGALILRELGGSGAFVAGLALAGTIVLYDLHHKANPLSPVLMGLCRAGVYVTAALAFGRTVCPGVITGAVLLSAWVVGLTYAAKQETRGRITKRWPLLFLVLPLAYAAVRAPESPLAILPALALLSWLRSSLAVLRTDIPAAVGRFIAGISLLDALLIASRHQPSAALLAVICFALTRIFQRTIPGT